MEEFLWACRKIKMVALVGLNYYKLGQMSWGKPVKKNRELYVLEPEGARFMDV